MVEELRRRRSSWGSGRSWTRCRATRAGMRRSWPRSVAPEASMSSPRPASTTSATTARALERTAARERAGRPLRADMTMASTRTTMRPGRRRSASVPGSSSRRCPAARPSATDASSRPRPRPPRDRRADPHPLRGRHRRLEQVAVLRRRAPAHIALSHVDKVVDRGTTASVRTGASAIDQRVPLERAANGTLQLLDWAAEDGLLDTSARDRRRAPGLLDAVSRWAPGRPGSSTGSAARWRRPGWTPPSAIDLFVDNPARAFAFAASDGGAA